ncbi:uncharacterized protein LOC132067996 [Lycium ferocissimum]|uniref:uncharacterized protein LOC132067996 n=1 Tax=Lycium ferocissimum TaxID=112874 RepID=UPI002815E292|nr:uncharacterized protein LOC132067996 [Lycium ferocissimum]
MEKVRSFEVVLPLLALGGVALWINYYYRKRPTISRGQQEAAEVDDAKEDYFSQLPDDVLFSILANLTVCEAARTTILSTKWKYIFYLGVERLDLSFSRFVSYPISYPIKDFSKFFKFSVEILSQASSLKQLTLSNCIVLSSPNIRFNSLTTLVLNGVLLASGHLEGILSSCSKLKQLIIENCRLPYKLRLTSTVTSIVIWDCDGVKEIDLHAADLHTLEFTMNNYNNSNYFPTETKMFRNLRTLSLILMIMDDSFEFEMVKLSPILGTCPLLQYLSFVVSYPYS